MFRLRIGERDILLHDGDSVVGRADGCAVLLDDALLSREHAKIVVHGAEAKVQDLGSRNGTYVNGNRLTAPATLHSGDVIRVGHTEMTIHAVGRKSPRAQSNVRTVGFDTRVDSSPGGEPSDLALRMIRLGRLDEAEKLLKGRAMLLASDDSPLPVNNLMSQTVQQGLLAMAEQTMDAVWIHRLLKLHVHCDWFMTEPVQQQTDRLLRAIGRPEGDGLTSYLALWAPRATDLTPPEQQQIQRLQELASRFTPGSAGERP